MGGRMVAWGVAALLAVACGGGTEPVDGATLSGATDLSALDSARSDARGGDAGACGPSSDVCATCLATKCCGALVSCVANTTCATAWMHLMTCRASGQEPDLCYGHEFLGDLSGPAGAAVTDCAIYGACSASCAH